MTISIDGYPIDLAISEDHNFESEVTKYPAESGSKLTDNIQNNPAEITLEGVVSDTPIGKIATDPTRQFTLASVGGSGNGRFSSDAYERLLAIREAREPVTIETTLGKFDSMALTKLSVPISKDTGRALRFTVTFTQIEIKVNKRTTSRVAVPNGTGKTNGGNRQLKNRDGTSAAGTGKWQRYVNSHPVKARASLVPTYGQPILTTTRKKRFEDANGLDPIKQSEYETLSKGLGYKDPFDTAGGLGGDQDHYPVATAGTSYADGYVKFLGKDNEGFYFAHRVYVDRAGQESTLGLPKQETERVPQIDGHDVKYDPKTREWKDASTGKPVRKVPTNTTNWKDGVTEIDRPADPNRRP